MALQDLLWACPICGRDRGLSRGKRVECRGCGTRFGRVRGALIRAEPPAGSPQVRSAAEWIAELPAPETYLEGKGPDEVIRTAATDARRVVAHKTIRGELTGPRDYLNRIETYGPQASGTVELTPSDLVWTPETGPGAPRDGDPAPDSVRWPLGGLTAVQASSSSLQILGEGQPLTSFHFSDDAVYFWELLIHEALRALYRRTGRGEITEFQPRITTR